MRATAEQRARVLTLRAQGVATREIAERLGLSRAAVAALLRRPTFAPRACELCGEPFVPTNGRQRYCTRAHRLEHDRRGGPTIRRCRLCGEPFEPTNGRQRFCTPAHQREHQLLHGPPRTTAGWRERVGALEAEIARARAELDDREAA